MAHPSPAVLTLLAVVVLGSSALVVAALPSPAISGSTPGLAADAPYSPPPMNSDGLSGPLAVATPVKIPVGGYPDSVLVDPTNGTAFVASQYGDNVSAISLANDEKIATIPVGYQPYPGAIALDTTNWTVYVVNAASGNVSVIGASSDAVVASVPVQSSPDAVLVNPVNHDVYVANGGSGTVSIISPETHLPKVVDTVPVGPNPDGFALDTAGHDVFVADAGTDNVSVISEKTNSVIKSIPVGTAPAPFGAIAYDPEDGNVYVVNVGSDNVSVIGGKNLTLFATVAVGSGPGALVVDPTLKEIFVANRDSDNVSVIATVNNTVVATIPVGQQPGLDGALAFDPSNGYVYVPNSGSSDVSVIDAAKHAVVATIPVDDIPDAVGVDPVNGAVFVANQGSSTVTNFVLSAVTFESLGLPAGSPWSISLGSPPVVGSNTTVKGRGTLQFVELVGRLPFSAAPPAGYAISKITGPDNPATTSINLTGVPATFVLSFGKIEPLTFSETGLAPGTEWGVAISASPSHGTPAAQRGSSTTPSITFTVVKDAWKFSVIRSSKVYKVAPAAGTAAVGAHPLTKRIKFTAITAAVLFEEAGLASKVRWQVNVTGPMDVDLSSTAPTIKFLLVNGTYSFVVWNFSKLHPFPASGTFVVVAPHAPLVVSVSYTSTPRHASPPTEQTVEGAASLAAAGPVLPAIVAPWSARTGS